MTHPLAALLGTATNNTVRDRLQAGRPYTMADVWLQTQRLSAIPLATLFKINDLVLRFTQIVTLPGLIRAFDLAVPLIATWTTPAIQQLLTACNANAFGHTHAEWGAIGAGLTAGNATSANAQQFAQIPLWPVAEIATLAQAFNANPHGMTAAQWRAFAVRLQALNMTAATAIGFIALPSPPWTPGEKGQIATRFQAAPHGLTAVQYAAIAAALTGPRANSGTVNRFAGMGNYAADERVALARSFDANQVALSAEHWLLVIDPLTALHATAANAEAFVRLAGWVRAERRLLTQAFQANQQGMSAAEWAAVATQLTGANARSVIGTPLIAIAAWLPAQRAALATAFQANARGLTTAQWAAIATPLTGPRATAATAAAFAAVVTWTAAERASLSTTYEANQHGLNLLQWTTLANSFTGVRATALTVGHFASIGGGWAAPEKLALAVAFEANQHGITAQQCAAIAVSLNGVHRTAATVQNFVDLPGWAPATRALLAAAFVVNARGRSAVEWGAVARHLTDGRAIVANVTAFLNIAGWTAADEAILAREFNANTRNRIAPDWVNQAAPLYTNTHNGAIRTSRHMAYLARGWRNTVNLNGVVYSLRGVGSQEPGLVYAGPGPHITIHNLDIERSPGEWQQHGQDFQVVLNNGGPHNTYPHQGNQYSPFPGNPQPQAVPPPDFVQARALALAFWAAV